MLVYLVLALRRAYDLPAAGALWRSLVIASSYSIVLVATLASIVLPAVLRHGAAH
jgi:hypothetical protein